MLFVDDIFHPALTINTWIVIQKMLPQGPENSVSFHQDWAAYRNGFGYLPILSNYWLGLEAVYSLVSTGQYQLNVEVS